jgi:hypothetical protein
MRKVREYGKEIARLTKLCAELGAKLVEITREYHYFYAVFVSRGIAIAVYMHELMQTQDRFAAAQSAPGNGSSVMKKRNAAIYKLNALTIEFNYLVDKCNKLSKSR